MTTDKIVLWLLGIGLIALLLGNWKRLAFVSAAENASAPVDTSNVPTVQNVERGPEYLIYNQGPWAFSPPVNNFLPSMVQPGGQAVVITPPPGQGRYGCFEC